ncbi:MAP7 domain-containing protein 1 isoform X3 [Folsomia candida]|uniref:MAP7 domain-containing protein 1 isoform X3 n=1 Tax=Folsomia candida TaxID=158441 RepID=UPI001604E908|nr:MAP7 domain-containing protein 1 isoform X3 [Folsomia candida]
MDQLILLPSILLHENNQLVQDDLAALSWPGCGSSFGGGRSSFCGSRVTFTANGTFYVCVQNDGMSDQATSQGQRGVAGAGVNGGGSRPSSATARERHERIHLLKEKQDHDRLKKLEELKEQAFAASRLRDEQDSRRKKHFEELVKKEDERRRQAEERRRMLDEERKLTLQAKWESKSTKPCPRAQSAKPAPVFAFGSCTPRLIDNQVDGSLWKSQYNLNVTRAPGMRASSATDLHLQQNEGADAMRVFCGRRRTDLTPTIPIKREVYDMSASMMSTRSTTSSRGGGSGRVFYSSVSMTRLDRSRSPGCGNLAISAQHQHQGQRPSRSKSTTHLASTGLKMTRTEILRQALAQKKDKDGGFRSVDQSRPPSSMSSSIMTSSTHSQVPMRPRNMTSRKSRPASVHVTGITQQENTNNNNGDHRVLPPSSSRRRMDASQERKTTSSTPTAPPPAEKKKPEPRKILSGKISPSPSTPSRNNNQQQLPGETGTMKRPIKRTPSAPKEKPTAAAAAEVKKVEKQEEPAVAAVGAFADTNPFSANNNPFSESAKEINTVNENELVNTVPVGHVELNNSKNYVESMNGNRKVIENFESIESAFASGSDYSSKTPEPNPVNGQEEIQVSAMDDLLGSELDFTATTNNVLLVAEVNNKSVSPTPLDTEDSSKPKIMTEEQAKAAIAEKRKLAREAVEREAALKLEEQRLEEERQRLEAEEADRFARESRAAEEERLRIAIEEQQKREEEERQRQIEDEKARIEKEKQEREAAREAEKVRLEMEERLKREEEERLERRKRVEAIMARTRKKEQEQQQQQAKTNSAEAKQGIETTPVNGHKDNNGLLGDVQSSNNSINNNYNNNNDFGNNSTLIEFDGMNGEGGLGGGQESNNLLGDSNTGLLSNSTTTSNPLINNPLQDLLS